MLLARLDVVRRPGTRPLDIGKALQELAAWARERSPGTPIEVVAEPGIVAAVDEAALREAIRNLIVNALSYAPSAAIRITAWQRAEIISITVSDTGPGMDPEDAALAFERYYRGSGAIDIAGAGLGLSIVQSMAQRHGGHVEIASSRTTGTKVTLQLKTRKAVMRSSTQRVRAEN